MFDCSPSKKFGSLIDLVLFCWDLFYSIWFSSNDYLPFKILLFETYLFWLIEVVKPNGFDWLTYYNDDLSLLNALKLESGSITLLFIFNSNGFYSLFILLFYDKWVFFVLILRLSRLYPGNGWISLFLCTPLFEPKFPKKFADYS